MPSDSTVSGFIGVNYSIDDGPGGVSVMLTFALADGGELRLPMPLTVAAQVSARISEVIQKIDKEQGSRTTVQATPEKIMRYNAGPSRMEPDEVIIALDGDRSNRLLGRMKLTDARSLAALLTAAAERAGPKPTN
jgi:hypothetical protein